MSRPTPATHTSQNQNTSSMEQKIDYAAPRIAVVEAGAERGFALSALTTEDYVETPGNWNSGL